jgi:hypothetical protein
MPVDYRLAKIYKIESLNPEDESDIYIGSTCEPTLARRMAGHRRKYECWKNGKYHWVSSFKLFEKYGVNNCNIFLIEDYPCNNKDQLRKQEGNYIKSMPCVNKHIAGQTHRESCKQYRNNHKEYLQTKYKCICEGCYTRNNKSSHYKSKMHTNYMRKHDTVIEEVNQVLESINKLKLI